MKHLCDNDALPTINGAVVTHTFKGKDGIITESEGELRHVLFVDGTTELIHRTRLLPIRIPHKPTNKTAHFVFNDGGRANAGYQGEAGDCVTRAIAIAAELDYQQVYTALANGTGQQRATSKRAKRPASARNGIDTKRKWFKDYMQSLGYTWIPTMHIGQGCKIHLNCNELPQGRLIVAVSKHYTAVIDGVINDTHDCSRGGTRCVYGYWVRT